MNLYQQYIHMSRYARWLPDQQRRETWEETVDRYLAFFRNKLGDKGLTVPWHNLRTAILNMEIMPSMRCMMTAGPALERDNVAGYNCSYVAIDHQRAFDEIMYILMCGTGVGFSVERQYIAQLPEVNETFHNTETVIKVYDSKLGWARAYRELVSLLYQGLIPSWDMSSVRPAGAPLKTFGGRASGPEPLAALFRFTVEVFRKAAGRRLTSLEVHDLICKVAEVVVCGGVRRSALLSLSNLTDERMRKAKAGEWYYAEPQRMLANNSVAYTEKPDMRVFMREWINLYESKSGERGIFNRSALKRTIPERRDAEHDFGTNPCSEIILRSQQFCNLSEAIVRPDDTYATVRRKVQLATILGTMQATLTDFRYLRRGWKNNTEEEALLGVSLTGIMDNTAITMESKNLNALRYTAEKTNRKYAQQFGINPAAAITCVKPSGTVSQLVDCSSGIHARYAPYYIRRVRGSKDDPVSSALINAGVKHETDIANDRQWVFEFPMKSPEGAVVAQDLSAIQQLEIWEKLASQYCEHKPSVSIYVREDEWLEVAAWVYKHFELMSGVSFFPHSDHIYPQAPYEEITAEQYAQHQASYPIADTVNWSPESVDNTTGSQELACHGGACEI